MSQYDFLPVKEEKIKTSEGIESSYIVFQYECEASHDKKILVNVEHIIKNVIFDIKTGFAIYTP